MLCTPVHMSGPVQVPSQVIHDLQIAHERTTLIAMYAHAQKDGVVPLNADELGAKTGQSGHTVRRHIHYLVDRGYVTSWKEIRDSAAPTWVYRYRLVLRPSGRTFGRVDAPAAELPA